MKKTLKRIMALTISAVMIFGCIPCNIASADATPTDWSLLANYMDMKEGLATGVIKNGDVDVFEVTDGGYTIKLLKDITAEEGDSALVVKTLQSIYALKLDLNGHILNRGLIDSNGVIIGARKDEGSVIKVEEGKIFITDSCESKPVHNGMIKNGVWVPSPDGTITIEGGIIMGGTGTKNNNNEYEGGAIKLNADTVFTLVGGTICGNLANYGAGIYISGNIIINAGMTGGSICYNKADTNGGGVYIEGSFNKFSLEGGTVSHNTATNGGGIYNNIGKVTLNDGTVSDNTATNNGGGIYNERNGTVILNGGTVSDNKATNSDNTVTTNGGGIYNEGNGTVTLNGGSILSNTAKDGGGIYNNGSGTVTVTLNGGSISNNTATAGGGGIYNKENGSVILNGGIVSVNTAANNGGGICNEGIGIIVLNGGTVSNNSATNGGGIHTVTGELDLIKGVIEKNSNPAIQTNGMNTAKFYFPQDELVFDGSIKDSSDIYYLVNVNSDYVGKLSSTPAYGVSGTDVTIFANIPYAYLTVDGEKIDGNTFKLADKSVTISLVEPQRSSSKKYKAINVNDADIKITGTGKKGSKRTIVPQEGRKVASVIVTDKDGNKIDVTMNADGTYSFVQPAENVNVEVTYKNREITLNIGSTEASVDGERENLDVCPVIRNDRTMLPIRYVAENLGAKVEWNPIEANMIYITKGNKKIEIKLGSDIMKVDDKEVKLDSVAFAENDRTYLPVRAVSEALDAYVEWNENEPSIVKIYEQK